MPPSGGKSGQDAILLDKLVAQCCANVQADRRNDENRRADMGSKGRQCLKAGQRLSVTPKERAICLRQGKQAGAARRRSNRHEVEQHMRRPGDAMLPERQARDGGWPTVKTPPDRTQHRRRQHRNAEDDVHTKQAYAEAGFGLRSADPSTINAGIAQAIVQ